MLKPWSYNLRHYDKERLQMTSATAPVKTADPQCTKSVVAAAGRDVGLADDKFGFVITGK
jgi:hypothetical protein